MSIIVVVALIFSSIIYLAIGFFLSNKNKTIGDLFPIASDKKPKVKTAREFSASTVATTVSLATLVLAYFELVYHFGVFLLWTVVTSVIGMILFSVLSKKIWTKLSVYEFRPTMHEFLGVEFNSKTLSLVASICTSIGFLLVFAAELVVGSRFLAKFIPAIPEIATVIFLSSIGFLYTVMGGFRAVIQTDKLQMKFIWGFIIVLSVFYLYYIFNNGGVTVNIAKIPENIFSLSNREGLTVFLIGVTIMNIPTLVSNMSVWQRISGAENVETVVNGFKKSIVSLFLTWTFFVLLACFAFMIVIPENSQSLLSDLLISISDNTIGKIVLFFIVLGMYGAMLSTASTNLIVVSHTISEDIVAKFKSKTTKERLNSKKDFYISRIILTLSTITAILFVVGLKYFGFSIADLVFAIYGGSKKTS